MDKTPKVIKDIIAIKEAEITELEAGLRFIRK